MSAEVSALVQIERSAVLSDCGRYRYMLERTWDTRPLLVFIMLNPSTADAVYDDQTIRVCMGRAQLMNAGGIRILNLFAFRATQPRVMLAEPDPVGPLNDQMIRLYLAPEPPAPMMVIAAWGNDGGNRDRERHVTAMVTRELKTPLYCLGVTKAGSPKHPLRIAYTVKASLWRTA